MNTLISMSALALLALLGCASSGASHDHAHEDSGPPRMLGTATATLEARSDSAVTGTVTFTEREEVFDGKRSIVIDVRYDITGITPGDTRGFHIHEVGDCSAPDATSAGGHFNPGGHQHGPSDHAMSHAGDLGNITANPAGRAEGLITGLTKITLGPGDHNILGRSVIVHAQADDLSTQPTGNAGARVACGIIIAAGQ